MFDLPLITYIATMSVTPGPNNLMLAASGVNHGLRRTVPHMLGISVGFAIQAALVSGTLAWAMTWLQAIRLPLMVVGCAYLLWLAWRQLKAGRPAGDEEAKPLSFLGAALFQWVNPKAWMFALNLGILFLPRQAGLGAILWLALLCMLVGGPCMAVWAVTGDRLRRWLNQPRALLLFNGTMAFLLALTALWLLWDELKLFIR
jgi:threonine/homoserine/homoserine lactone efflux protein